MTSKNLTGEEAKAVSKPGVRGTRKARALHQRFSKSGLDQQQPPQHPLGQTPEGIAQ